MPAAGAKLVGSNFAGPIAKSMKPREPCSENVLSRLRPVPKENPFNASMSRWPIPMSGSFIWGMSLIERWKGCAGSPHVTAGWISRRSPRPIRKPSFRLLSNPPSECRNFRPANWRFSLDSTLGKWPGRWRRSWALTAPSVIATRRCWRLIRSCSPKMIASSHSTPRCHSMTTHCSGGTT